MQHSHGTLGVGQVMMRRAIEWLMTACCMLGCGIAQRTVSETGDGDGDGDGMGGASMLAGGGRAGALAMGGKASGGAFALGGTGSGGAPLSCGGAPNPLPLRPLSTWEYGRSVARLTGVEVTRVTEQDYKEQAPFAFSMDWGSNRAQQVLDEAEKQGAAARDGRLLPCDITKPADGGCVSAFVDDVVGRAFRRPLTDDERKRYVSLFRLGSSQGDMASGVELVVEAALLSPLFLHKIYLGSAAVFGDKVPLTAYEVAARLSFLLAGGPPDAELSQVASNGQLSVPAAVEMQARRLLAAPTFIQAAQHFHDQWLGLDELPRMLSSELTAELVASMREQTEGLVARVFQGDRSLVKLLSFDSARHDGILTQPSLLTRFNNPTQRGKFVRERLLCMLIPPPPPSVNTQIEIKPGQTRRQAWEQHRTDAVCAGCHQLMDPIGFAFENFDELGHFRDTDNGLPVDTSGVIQELGDTDRAFDGVGELSSLLVSAPEVSRCVSQTWLGYALQRRAEAGDVCTVERGLTALVESKLDIGELLVALVGSEQFLTRDHYMVQGGQLSPQPASGPVDTLVQRRKAVLDFSMAEARWLQGIIPREDQPALDAYLSALRELELQLSQQ